MKARWTLVVLCCVVVLAIADGAAAQGLRAEGLSALPQGESIVEMVAGGQRVEWLPRVDWAEATLTIVGPNDFQLVEVFERGSRPGIDVRSLSGDGAYTYEIRLAQTTVGRLRSEAAAGGAGAFPAVPLVQSGAFTVLGGGIVPPDLTEMVTRSASAAGGTTGPAQVGVRPLDVVHSDDVIITGSECIGYDCLTDGTESFGFDTLKMKENNIQIFFDDTSTTAGFPANDWRLIANDSSSGGGSYLAIQDSTGAKVPFKVQAGARTNALFVNSAGKIGLGTATPVLNIHTVAGDTPALRFDQDTSSGWTAQVWDMAGNESNFFVRDTTGGSKLPFRIQPGTPTNTVTLKSNGNVGVGTWSPAYQLHALVASNTFNGLIAESTDGAGTGAGAMFGALANWGSLGFQVHGSGRTISRYGLTLGGWAEINQASGGNGLILATRTATPLVFATNTTERLRILSNGNVGIGTTAPAGTLDVNGSIYQRGGVLHADYVFEPGYRLESIEEHERFAWEHKRLPGIPGRTVDSEGREVVELGASQRGIVEELEKAHIYIGQLNDQLKAKDRQMLDLAEQVRALNEKLAQLAERLERQSD